ncbi:chloride channel [Globomyces pollinis-pini]|nr:chloride channel [Globomyces pollinis-pini]
MLDSSTEMTSKIQNPSSIIIDPLLPDTQNLRQRLKPMESIDLMDDNVYENFTTIDWMRDWMKDYEREHKNSITHHPSPFIRSVVTGAQTWVLLSIIGVTVGLLSSCIYITAAFFSDLKRGKCESEWYLSKDICCKELVRYGEYCNEYRPHSYHVFGTDQFGFYDFLIYCITATIFATTAVILVTRLSIYAPKSGLSEIKTILGGFIINGFFGARTLLIKSVGLVCSIASGLSIGKEAPMIHLACCVGNLFQNILPKYRENEARKREILSASVAAGVAVAFGAPIGGVLMSLEGLSSFFPSKTMLRSFFCALVASVTLQFIDPYRGKQVLYQASYTRNWYFFEIIFFAFLGILGGLSGAFFIKMNMKIQHFRKTYDLIKDHPIMEVAALALLTSILGSFSIYTRIDGSELLEALFRECKDTEHLGLCDANTRISMMVSLFWALVVKAFLSVITYGTQIPAGVFMPAMIWGGLYGRILGELVQGFQQEYSHWSIFSACPAEGICITPGMYSLLGAMGALGGITKLTVSITVIMFELTGTLNYIVPCMVTLIVAKFVGDSIIDEGIIENMIRLNGFPYLNPRQEIMINSNVGDKMTKITDLVCFTGTGMTLHSLETLINQTDFQGYPIITSPEDPSLIGYVNRVDVVHALQKFKKLDSRLDPNTAVYFDEPELPGPTFAQTEVGLTTSMPSLSVHVSNTLADQSNEISISSIHLTPYVNQTPLGVHPSVTMDFALDLFKKMGTRYILIKEQGKLLGLLTKKDLLQIIDTKVVNNRPLWPADESLPTNLSADLDFERNTAESNPNFRYRTLTVEEQRELLDMN